MGLVLAAMVRGGPLPLPAGSYSTTFPGTPKAGSPGIGFWNIGATNSEYGFSAFSAMDNDSSNPRAPTNLVVVPAP